LISMGLHRFPTSEKGLVEYLAWGSLGYIINGQKFSLHDIKHGILRGNRKASRRKVKYLISKHDPRAQYILGFDARIHFALISGVNACPAIGIYNHKTLDFELNMAMEGFLYESVMVDKNKKEIIIPKLFYYYNKDFGKNDGSMLKWISDHLVGQKKEDFDVVIKHKFTLVYNKFEWDLSNASTVDNDSSYQGEVTESLNEVPDPSTISEFSPDNHSPTVELLRKKP